MDLERTLNIPATGNNLLIRNRSHYELYYYYNISHCEQRAEDCMRKIKDCITQMLSLFCVVNKGITAFCNQQSMLSSGGLQTQIFKMTTYTCMASDFRLFKLLSMELTHPTVNARLMHFLKGSFVCSRLSICLEYRVAVTSTP